MKRGGGFVRIAIIDDSKVFREKILQLLLQKFDHNQISAFPNIKEYEISTGYYDLLLLDIELKTEDGIAYVKRNSDKQRYVIYVTSHSDYVYDAFYPTVVGFIPKDQLNERLIEKIDLVETLVNQIKTYQFQTLNGKCFVEEDKILYIYYEDQTVCIKIENQKIPLYASTRSLKEIQQNLSDNFYLISRNYIINMKKIQQLITSSHEVLMPENIKLKVSDHKWANFKTAYHVSRYHHV